MIKLLILILLSSCSLFKAKNEDFKERTAKNLYYEKKLNLIVFYDTSLNDKLFLKNLNHKLLELFGSFGQYDLRLKIYPIFNSHAQYPFTYYSSTTNMRGADQQMKKELNQLWLANFKHEEQGRETKITKSLVSLLHTDIVSQYFFPKATTAAFIISSKDESNIIRDQLGQFIRDSYQDDIKELKQFRKQYLLGKFKLLTLTPLQFCNKMSPTPKLSSLVRSINKKTKINYSFDLCSFRDEIIFEQIEYILKH